MKQITLIILVMLLLVGVVNAVESFVFEKDRIFTIEVPMAKADKSKCPTCTCEYSIFYPNGSSFVKSIAGTNIDSFCVFRNQTDLTGTYTAEMYFTNTIDYGRTSFEFIVSEDGVKPSADGNLSVTLFVVLITIAIFLVGIKAEFTKHKLANYILKRCCIIIGLFLTSLNTGIVVTFADNAGLGVTRELFRYLWLINWTIYISILFLMWKTLIGSIDIVQKIRLSKRMGED